MQNKFIWTLLIFLLSTPSFANKLERSILGQKEYENAIKNKGAHNPIIVIHEMSKKLQEEQAKLKKSCKGFNYTQNLIGDHYQGLSDLDYEKFKRHFLNFNKSTKLKNNLAGLGFVGVLAVGGIVIGAVPLITGAATAVGIKVLAGASILFGTIASGTVKLGVEDQFKRYMPELVYGIEKFPITEPSILSQEEKDNYARVIIENPSLAIGLRPVAVCHFIKRYPQVARSLYKYKQYVINAVEKNYREDLYVLDNVARNVEGETQFFESTIEKNSELVQTGIESI